MTKGRAAPEGKQLRGAPEDKQHRETPKARWLPIGLIILLLVIVPFIVFEHVRGQDFVQYDDNINIFNNPYLDPSGTLNLAYLWQHPYLKQYIPLSYTAFAGLMLLARLPAPNPRLTEINTALNPHIFHTANLIVHIANILLVFFILRLLVRKNWPAAAGALLFGLHPLEVESVAWVSELRGLMCGTFCLLCIWLSLCHRLASPDNSQVVKRRAYYFSAIVAAILALLCKSSAVSLPLIIVVLDRFCFGTPWRRSLLSSLPFFLLSAAFTLIMRTVQVVPPELLTPIWTRPFIAGDSLAFYLWKFLIPVNLGIDYGRTPQYVTGQWWGYGTWLAPAGVAVIIWLRRKSSPWLVAAGAISVCVLLPVLGLVPFRFQHYSTVADRYAYLALLGPALALAWVCARYEKWPVMLLFCLSALSVCGSFTILQVRYWDNTFTLFEHAITVNTENADNFDRVGDMLDHKGKTQDALVMYANAARVNPNDIRAHANLGIGLMELHKPEAAVAEFREVLRIDPKNVDAHTNLGDVLCLAGKIDEAVPELREALRLNPNLPTVHFTLGLALASQRKKDEAVSELREALRLQSDYPAAQSLLDKLLSASGR